MVVDEQHADGRAPVRPRSARSRSALPPRTVAEAASLSSVDRDRDGPPAPGERLLPSVGNQRSIIVPVHRAAGVGRDARRRSPGSSAASRAGSRTGRPRRRPGAVGIPVDVRPRMRVAGRADGDRRARRGATIGGAGRRRARRGRRLRPRARVVRCSRRARLGLDRGDARRVAGPADAAGRRRSCGAAPRSRRACRARAPRRPRARPAPRPARASRAVERRRAASAPSRACSMIRLFWPAARLRLSSPASASSSDSAPSRTASGSPGPAARRARGRASASCDSETRARLLGDASCVRGGGALRATSARRAARRAELAVRARRARSRARRARGSRRSARVVERAGCRHAARPPASVAIGRRPRRARPERTRAAGKPVKTATRRAASLVECVLTRRGP